MNKRKICVVTGTRAEYGLLYWLMKEIKADEDLELQIIATGMHLSPEFGLTYKQIEEDGFIINEKVEMLLSSDSTVGIAKSMGLATIGFADSLERLKPNILVILGDRFEMLAVAQVAMVMQFPIAHIHGGELTFGAYDDSFRHSITKMSTWHFVSTVSHRNRVIQLGENPDRVWNVGALGIENIVKLPLLNKEDLYNELGLDMSKRMFLITLHPETNGDANGIDEVLYVMNDYKQVNLVFTKANADNGGRLINEKIEKFVEQNKNAKVFSSLGQLRYLSAVKYAEAVIGNSSSGLIEVPYLQTPTVNCGNRQAGREKPLSVIDTELTANSLKASINNAILYRGPFQLIFGDGNTSIKIVDIIKNRTGSIVRKEFYDI